MKEQLISFETAKLAKEKGFNISNSGYFYDKKGDKIMDTPLDKFLWGGKYPASTQSLLQQWFKEKHNIFLQSRQLPLSDTEWTIVDLTGKILSKACIHMYYDGYPLKDGTFTNHGLELELQKALKLLKNVKPK